MTTRTISQTIYFKRPFTLQGYARTLPAGAYDIEIEELILDTMISRAYRQTLVSIHLPPDPERPGIEETLTIDPHLLDAALLNDIAPACARPNEAPSRRPVQGTTAAIERGENEGMALTPRTARPVRKFPFLIP